jgi:hypothetical protein
MSCDPPVHEHCPPLHVAPGLHAWPHDPQLFGSVRVSTQDAPQASCARQVHAPLVHAYVCPRCDLHPLSTCGSSSTTPLQSSSLPLHVSVDQWHWQMLLGCPMSAPHDQPATQSLGPVHVVVQTLPLPVGRQMPLWQSPFLLQGLPVSPLRGA